MSPMSSRNDSYLDAVPEERLLAVEDVESDILTEISSQDEGIVVVNLLVE